MSAAHGANFVDGPARVAGARRQATIGLALAAAIILAWLTVHVLAVFHYSWTGAGLLLAPVLVAVQTWLSVGLFIVAHDCMHGSLAPFRPGVNRWVGRLCLFLYAGFSFDRLIGNHFAHHRHAGTAEDPDFDEDHPRAYWAWFWTFFREYFGWRELVTLVVLTQVYLQVLGAPLTNTLAFWALPAILSAVQLFTFGTWLPHRETDDAFGDRHRARSNDYSWTVSLLTCFHFGYHHEHHSQPHMPWWRLPETRRAR